MLKLIFAAVTVGVCAADLNGYNKQTDKACDSRNEGGSTTGGTLEACSNSCDTDSTCISFEYYFTGSLNQKCQWSTSCTVALMGPTSDQDMDLYTKRATCNKKADGAAASAVTNADCVAADPRYVATVGATGLCAAAPCDMSVAGDKNACCTIKQSKNRFFFKCF